MAIVLHLLVGRVITITQVEQVAARTSGSGEIERKEHAGRPKKNGGGTPTVSHRQAPPEPAATLAGKVYALASDACRWPLGDPQRLGFRFCGSPVTRPPYCAQHRAVAYMALPHGRSAPFRLSVRTISPVRKLAAAV